MTALRSTSLLFLALASSCAHCGPDAMVWVETTEQWTFPAGDLRSIDADSRNGSVGIRVEPSRQDVLVTAGVRAGGPDQARAEAELSTVEVRCRLVADGRLELAWTSGDTSGCVNADVEFEIAVPAALPARVETRNGAIVATVAGRSVLSTWNGSLTVDGPAEDLDVSTRNGSIRVEAPFARLLAVTGNGAVQVARTCAGPVEGEVQTHNGRVDLELAPGSDTELRCSVRNGRIRIDAALRDATDDGREVRGLLGAGGPTFSASTNNGSITVRAGG